MTEFLRLSGIYWGVTALDLMNNVDKVDQDEIVEYIKKCQCSVSGGISPCEGHDPHILYTLSAVQVILTFTHIIFQNRANSSGVERIRANSSEFRQILQAFT